MNKNDSKEKKAPKRENLGQKEPMSGSKKVKNQNHTHQKHNQHHDM